jgi:hypothetical protein
LEPYHGTHRFAVIKFHSPEDAKDLVRMREPLVVDGEPNQFFERGAGVRVEQLNPAWMRLARREGRGMLVSERLQKHKRLAPRDVSADAEAAPLRRAV